MSSTLIKGTTKHQTMLDDIEKRNSMKLRLTDYNDNQYEDTDSNSGVHDAEFKELEAQRHSLGALPSRRCW